MRPFVLMLLLFTPLAFGQVEAYKVVGADGSVEFTDQPVEGAESVLLGSERLGGVRNDSPTIAPGAGAGEPARQQKAISADYDRLAVISPVAETVTQRHNGPHRAVVELQPPLDAEAGHRFLYELDGEIIGTSTAPRFDLGDLYRGAHSVRVSVIDADGRILIQSDPVTFYIRQHSRLFE